jgi:hypothetical protein
LWAPASQLKGWTAHQGHRSSGGTYIVYHSPDGRRFRSSSEIWKYLGFVSLPAAAPPADDNKSTKRTLTATSGCDFWVACDRCRKWRRLYLRGSCQIPEKWYCELNPDPLHDDCSHEQEIVPEAQAEDNTEGDEASAMASDMPGRDSDKASSALVAAAVLAQPQQLVIAPNSAQSAKAAGKRPRESALGPPPGCIPPSRPASQYPEDRCVQSADGSTWKVELEITHNSVWKMKWVFVKPCAGPTAHASQLTSQREEADEDVSEMAACRHCGKMCSLRGRGLQQ